MLDPVSWPSIVLLGVAGFVFLAGIVANVIAMGAYFRRPDASPVGFGFATYYYGEMRRDRPRLFALALGGPFLGLALGMVAGLLR